MLNSLPRDWESYPTIVHDDYNGSRALVQRLLQDGAKSFLYVMGGERVSICQERYRGFQEVLAEAGECYIQDPSTLLAPTLLAVQPGECIADLCCAPGGKSRCIAECLRGEGSLWCADVAQDKLPRVRQNLAPFANVEVHCLNAATDTLAAEQWDAILLDVPCSNTGVIRRRPDVRSGFSMAKLKALLQLQAQILNNCAIALNPRGRLVYSTCSIEPEENQEQVKRFLDIHPGWHCITQRTIFPAAGHDGGFCALLARVV